MYSFKAAGEGEEVGQVGPPRAEREQLFRRLEVCSSLLSRNETDPFFDRIVTVDEKCVFYDNRRRSWRWLDSDEPPRKFPKPLCTCERQCSLFFGPTSALFISNSSKLDNRSRLTIIAICSKPPWKKLLEKRPALANRRRVILLQNNARPHVGRKTLQKMANWGWNLCLIHHIHRTSREQIITFLSTWNFTCATDLENDILQFFESKKPAFYAAGMFHVGNAALIPAVLI
ncbi:hypothetical protein M513_10594, partial [Trichuris suis]